MRRLTLNPTPRAIITHRLEKAVDDWEAACRLAAVGAYSSVINRLYFAAFHAVSALLFQRFEISRRDKWAKATFELHYVKTGVISVEWGAFYAMLFKEDLRNDYEDFVVFTADDVLPLIPQTAEFIGLIKSLIDKN